jgi:outer membrane receptor protein involved in Fe transport
MGRLRIFIQFTLLGLMVLYCQMAWAQTISGTVTDSSGKVLPGVAVEASSPALIEKSRTVSTNDVGQYMLVNLKPGTYSVSFTLPGFSVTRQDNVVLTTGFTAQVNVELKVGGIQQTVTVETEAPIVDVQGNATPKIMTRDVMDELPTARSPGDLAIKIPGGGAGSFGAIAYRGNADALTKIDGMRVTNMIGAGPSLSMAGAGFSNEGYQEYSFMTGAESAETGQPGLLINLVPKDGGNEFHGSMFATYTNDSFNTSNIDDALRAVGIGDPAAQLKFWDLNPSFGGPIKKDKLWFQGTFRYNGSNAQVLGSYADADPSPFKYVPDLSKPGINDNWAIGGTGRLSWQATPKDKVTGFYDHSYSETPHFRTPVNGFAPQPPEASLVLGSVGKNVGVKWTRTQSPKLLTEVSFSHYATSIVNDYPGKSYPWSAQLRATSKMTWPPPEYSISELSTGAQIGVSSVSDQNQSKTITLTAAASYVTGSHSLKAGFSLFRGSYYRPTTVVGDMTMTFLNGVPTQVNLSLPGNETDNLGADIGLYVQDRWRVSRRLTLNLALRYDGLTSSTPQETLPDSIWLPAQNFAPASALGWKDISPRLGFAYDPFGKGKTVVKASLGRFVDGETVNLTGAVNPIRTLTTTASRSWKDLNGDFTIFNANGTIQTDELGALSNPNFGKTVVTTTYDPDVLNGWFKRGYTWEYNLGMQHEVIPRVALNATWYHRWSGNQRATDNLSYTNADYDGPFCVTGPSDSRLLDGGGKQICGLYDVKPTAFGRPAISYVTFAKNIGTKQGVTAIVEGLDLSVNSRFSHGIFVMGGVDIRRSVNDNCDIFIDNPQKLYCSQTLPFRMDWKLNGAYTLPWQQIRIATAYSAVNGALLASSWNAPNAVIAAALGRNLAGGATTKAIPLMEPNVTYTPYRHNFDVRLSKTFGGEKRNITGMLDLFNAFNSNAISAVNTTFGTAFLRPTTVVAPRQIRLSLQVRF